MALIDGSKEDLFVRLKNLQTVPLSFSDFIFSRIKSDETDPRLTQVRLTAHEEVTDYQGTQVVQYERLDLSLLPRMLITPPVIEPKDNLYPMLEDLSHALGIRFTEADLEDTEIENRDGTYVLTLKALPDSYGWVGECELTLQGKPSISIPIQQTNILW